MEYKDVFMTDGGIAGSANRMGQQKSSLHLHEQREQSLSCCVHSHNRVQEESETLLTHTHTHFTLLSTY